MKCLQKLLSFLSGNIHTGRTVFPEKSKFLAGYR